MGRTKKLEEPKQFGKYQLIAQLAIGRLGMVYKAKIVGVEGFEKIVTVKAINLAYSGNTNFIDALVMEAQRVVSLSHANICQVFDLGQEPSMGQYYIASEYVSGFDLARTVSLMRLAQKPIPLEIAVYVVSEVAKGLDYAHRRKDFNFNNLNLAHRSLTPENIMISFDGEVKVSDFGISRALAEVQLITSADKIRMHKYAAPEVARGEAATQSSDIFSLGLVFYELLTGTHPYKSEDPDEVLANALSASIAPLHEREDIPRPISKIVESMLVANPTGRSASANVVYEDLISFIYNHSLRAETRAMSVMMQELRRDERRLLPEDSTQEAGIEEISMSDLSVLQGSTHEFDAIKDSTNAELPSHKLEEVMMGNVNQPSLPGALEEYFNSARGGAGKAVLVSGSFGHGRTFLPDRLVDALGWRGNTSAFATAVTSDDPYVPFSSMGRLMLEVLDARSNPQKAVDDLRAMGANDNELSVFGGFWNLGTRAFMSSIRKTQLLVSLVLKFLRVQTKKGPLVLIFDRIEGIDDVSRDVLREVIRQISDKSLMLVMFTENAESVREAFDVGRREALEAVNVMGTVSPTLDQIDGLSSRAETVLAMVALHGGRLEQSEISQMTGIGNDQIMEVLRDLADRSFLRLPKPAEFLPGIARMETWAEQIKTPQMANRAGNVARYCVHRQRSATVRIAPTLVRLFAIAGERTSCVNTARMYAEWLESEGWHETALKFYQFVADVLSSRDVGSAEVRIAFLLSRAELALELSRIDVSRKTLEPIRALTDAHRDHGGSIRGLLLNGRLAMQQDDLEDAGEYFRKAMGAADAARDPELYATAALSLARWHMRYGDPVQGQQMLSRAMTVFGRAGTKKVNLHTRALLLNRAIRLYAERDLVTLAKSFLKQLETIETMSNSPKIKCRTAWATASIMTAEQNYSGAKEILARAEADAHHFGFKALHIELMRERAYVSLLSGDFESVMRVTDQLLPIARRHQDHYSVQRAKDLRATASCLVNRDVETSLEHLVSSLNRANERGVPRDIYRCHLNLARSLEATGQVDDAHQHRISAETFAREHRYSAVA